MQEIGYDSPRGGVSVVIERGIDKTTSHLLVQRATSKDSGTYKCSPLNTVEASINIHVLKGFYLLTCTCKVTFYNHLYEVGTSHI